MRGPWRLLAAAGRRAPALGAFIVLLLLVPLAADAQARPSGRPTGRGDGGAPVPPSSRTTPAPGDTTGAQQPAELITWIPDDSVMMALLKRPGYSSTRYQADTVAFDNATRTMTLGGRDSSKAGVQRDATVLVSRRLVYNDSTNIIAARGDSIILRDPARGEDIVGLREMTYNVETREGRTMDVSTVANSGADWRVVAHRATFATDSLTDRSTFWGRDGILTSCMDSTPHFHFLAREMKRISNSIIVARPAIVFVQDVPVMWLPFIFQDIRSGRRSGMLTPEVGVAEIVRNSPTYRRTIRDLGYYFAISDYMDATVSMNWRSAARATDNDPGWRQLEANFNYRWLDRFLNGGVAVARNTLSSGAQNLAVSWSHQQEFSSRTRFSTNVNYVTDTRIQRQTELNPNAVLATIASQANFQRQQGPFSINLGATQRQYPGRDQLDRTFPTLNVASRPITLGEWFVVTPSIAYNTSAQLNIDAVGDFAFRYLNAPAGLDSIRLKRDSYNRNFNVALPFKVWDFQVQADVRANEVANNFPEIKRVPDPSNPGQFIDRVYARTYLTTADYTLRAGLPQFFKGSWNLAPLVSLENVDPAGSLVRSERTNGGWVSQNKRLSYGLSVSPTFFALLPGIGAVQRLRHSITPGFSYGYSPRANVNPEFLAALGKNTTGYLGGLAQNRVSLSIATNLEAKLRSPSDSTEEEEGQKIRLASLQFTPLTYDFELARATGRTGLATDRMGYTFRSDLLPGFDLGVDYSLFLGSVLSDTAEFKPYRESVRFGFQITENSAIVRGIGRLMGRQPGVVASEQIGDPQRPTMSGGGLTSGGDPNQQGIGAVTGTRARNPVQPITTTGFQASFSVSQQRSRPQRGGRVIEFDPFAECAGFLGLPIYDFCLLQARQRIPTDPPVNFGTEGGSRIAYPPRTNVGLQTSFNLTPKWAASWSTSYDVEQRDFAAQTVTLQRDLHDWRAVFGFNRLPNGAFSFTFFISLKAQPEIKLPYQNRSFRSPSGTP